jgi:hypothetical protein
MYTCPVCALDPTSHSLRRIGETENGAAIFYTKPAEATKYWDRKGIRDHYDGTLGQIKSDWIWVFDAKGFSARHLFEVGVAQDITTLVATKYSRTLKEIRVVNSSWVVQAALHIVRPLFPGIQSILKTA